MEPVDHPAAVGEAVGGGAPGSRPRRWLVAAAVAVGLAAVVLGLRAARMPSYQVEVQPLAPVPVDDMALLARLAAGLRFRTLSLEPGEPGRADQFRAFQTFFAESHPRLHAELEHERISGLSLLYRWRGRDPSHPALVLLAHQDVVPVERGSEQAWAHPPFEGVVADGWIWGRGALDDKLSLFTLAAAVQSLLDQGFRPRGDVYLAFGHDEELGGIEGAGRIAALLAARDVEVGLVLDEGGSVVDGFVPGLDAPLAVVGVAEKGYSSIVLEVTGQGGHSSTPPPESAIGILAAAILRLEQQPFPARLGETTRAFFERGVGPESRFAMRLVYANLWLLEWPFRAYLDSIPGGSSLIRTTSAATIFEAGQKDNVMPARARAVVNFRVLPGDTTEGVLARARERVDDPRISISVLSKPREPSRPSSVDSRAWLMLARTIREVFPGSVVAPYLMFAGTDARHFEALCDCVYRFLPLRMPASDLRRAHGTNERVPLTALADAVRFYRRLIENASAADPRPATGSAAIGSQHLERQTQ